MPRVTLHSSSKVKRSHVTVTRRMNAVTENQLYLLNRTNLKLVYRWSTKTHINVCDDLQAENCVVVEVTTCRWRGHIVAAALQVAQLVMYCICMCTYRPCGSKMSWKEISP